MHLALTLATCDSMHSILINVQWSLNAVLFGWWSLSVTPGSILFRRAFCGSCFTHSRCIFFFILLSLFSCRLIVIVYLFSFINLFFRIFFSNPKNILGKNLVNFYSTKYVCIGKTKITFLPITYILFWLLWWSSILFHSLTFFFPAIQYI